MTTTERARHAAQRFARQTRKLGQPDLIRVQSHGPEGMACLCAVESAIAALWPGTPAKELVWLTQTAAPDSLRLQAFAQGELLHAATYPLGPADA